MSLADSLCKGVDRGQHVFRGKVPEDEGTDLCAGLAEGLCSVVVTVASGENRQADYRSLHCCPTIYKVRIIDFFNFCLGSVLIKERCNLGRIDPGITAFIGCFQSLQVQFDTIDNSTF